MLQHCLMNGYAEKTAPRESLHKQQLCDGSLKLAQSAPKRQVRQHLLSSQLTKLCPLRKIIGLAASWHQPLDGELAPGRLRSSAELVAVWVSEPSVLSATAKIVNRGNIWAH